MVCYLDICVSGCVRSGSNKIAAIKKHIPPIKVPRVTSMIFIGWPVVGRIYAATAETPNAIDPKRFKNAISQEILPVFQDNKE